MVCFLLRLLVSKRIKMKFKTGSLLSVLCVDMTLVHPLNLFFFMLEYHIDLC